MSCLLSGIVAVFYSLVFAKSSANDFGDVLCCG
jgi:hypothetical protein